MAEEKATSPGLRARPGPPPTTFPVCKGACDPRRCPGKAVGAQEGPAPQSVPATLSPPRVPRRVQSGGEVTWGAAPQERGAYSQPVLWKAGLVLGPFGEKELENLGLNVTTCFYQ